jgi:isocitrate/isopropylmalate dehydrogenase
MILVLTSIKGLYTVSLIEGDGIGPEISQSVKDIFAAAKVRTQSQWLGKCANRTERHL